MNFKLMRKIDKLTIANEFDPKPVGMLFNNCYLIRRIIASSIREHSSSLTGKILDYGCGSKPYEHFFESSEYIGIDVATSGECGPEKKAEFFFDGIRLPFPDDYFDGVLASEVFEHVFDLDVTLHEIHRVLKPGGQLLFTCPFVWPLHEQPYDFARYTPFALEQLLSDAGFRVISKQTKGTPIEVMGQMFLIEIIPVVLRPFNRFFRLRRLFELMINGTVNAGSGLLSPLFRKRGALYLSNVFVAGKPVVNG